MIACLLGCMHASKWAAPAWSHRAARSRWTQSRGPPPQTSGPRPAALGRQEKRRRDWHACADSGVCSWDRVLCGPKGDRARLQARVFSPCGHEYKAWAARKGASRARAMRRRPHLLQPAARQDAVLVDRHVLHSVQVHLWVGSVGSEAGCGEHCCKASTTVALAHRTVRSGPHAAAGAHLARVYCS